MTRIKEFFSSIDNKEIQLHIELGDDGRYNTKGIGTATFKRELGSQLHVNNVMYVPGVNKNLVSIFLLEYHGYDVVFSKEKAYIKGVATREVKKIGVWVKKIYKIEVFACVALSSKAEHVQG